MFQQLTFGGLEPTSEWSEPGKQPPDTLHAFYLIRECERVLPLCCDPSVPPERRAMLERAAEKLCLTLNLMFPGIRETEKAAS